MKIDLPRYENVPAVETILGISNTAREIAKVPDIDQLGRKAAAGTLGTNATSGVTAGERIRTADIQLGKLEKPDPNSNDNKS